MAAVVLLAAAALVAAGRWAADLRRGEQVQVAADAVALAASSGGATAAARVAAANHVVVSHLACDPSACSVSVDGGGHRRHARAEIVLAGPDQRGSPAYAPPRGRR